MAFAHITNLSAIPARVVLTGSGEELAVLKPGDETTVKTPVGSQVAFTDELDRIAISRPITIQSATQEIAIKDDVASVKTPGTIKSGRVKLLNTLDEPVDLTLLHSGDGAALVGGLEERIEPGQQYARAHYAGGGFRIRRPDGSKADLILLDPNAAPKEDPPIRIVDRYPLLDRLQAGDPNARQGRYDVLTQVLPASDPADSKYIRYGHQTLDSMEFNGWDRPVRRVTLSCVDVVFDEADRCGFLKDYQGAADIAELWLFADTVTVKTAVRLPSTDVHIHCRALIFEGNQACIDTTPLDKEFRDPETIDGEDGTKGGDIFVYTQHFRTDQKEAIHFRSRGSKGQDPDEGGIEVSPTARNLEVISEAKWDTFFSYENRKLPHEEVFGDKWGVTGMMPPKDYKQYKAKYGDIVYIEIRNSYYKNHIHTATSNSEVHKSWGTKEKPGKGGKGKRAGTPGTGGPGGSFTCSLGEIKRFVDLSGGVSGKALGPTSGGEGGTPRLACWLFFEGNPSGANHHINEWYEGHFAEKGDPSDKGPVAKAGKGADGACSVDAETANWVTEINLGTATQYAKDVCAGGRSDWAVATLTPYVRALEGKPIDADLEQPLREARELLRLAKANADFFGKPPGWVPTLSLLSAVDIYNLLLPQAMKELYASYYIERVARSKKDKQAALKTFSALLDKSVETAKDELKDLRKDLPKAMDALRQLMTQLVSVQEKTEERRKALIKKADDEVASAEQKEAIAAAFKITGAVIKAIPLPEPYQTAASGLGSIFDIAGGFVEDGASDAAFSNLKTQVAGFTENADNYSSYLNSLENATLDVGDLEKQANKARAVKNGLEEKYGKAAAALETLKTNRTQVYEAKKEALIYGRATSAQQRAAIVTRAGALTTSYQQDVQNLEAATNAKVGKYLSAKSKVEEIEGEITSKKEEFAKQETEREKKKAANTAMVATRMQQLKNAAQSVATIGATINKLAVSRTQLNSKFDAAIAKLAKEDQEFSNLCEQVKFLNGKKEVVAAQIAQISADISSRTDKISRNLLARNVIAGQIATDNESLDANALAYIQSVGQEAHLTLTRFLYYAVKAFEYYTVKPWKQSYVTAQKFFDDLRRVLEPSEFKLDGIMASDDQQAKLETLLKSPDPRNGGMLTAAEFGLLKFIYEKPLLDMGQQLAKELMEGNTTTLKESTSTITLTSDWLKQLNHRMAGTKQRDEVLLNLVDLRQIGRTVEKQRISNIRVKAVKAIKLGDRYPDSVRFIFEHVGKSVVRAEGKLFAFTPQSGAGSGGNEYTGSGIAFETVAQGGWTESSVPAAGGLPGSGPITGIPEVTLAQKKIGTPGELKQADWKEQQNLLSTLLNNKATLSLSHFRPGAFSDFVLRVEVNPLGSQVAFDEITLEVSYEGGISSRDEVLLCVNNNLGLELPVRTNLKDMSGRMGGSGRYVGVFNTQTLDTSDRKAVRVEVPSDFGRYVLKSWEVNGTPVSNAANSYEVAKDTYIVVHYHDRGVSSTKPLIGGHA